MFAFFLPEWLLGVVLFLLRIPRFEFIEKMQVDFKEHGTHDRFPDVSNALEYENKHGQRLVYPVNLELPQGSSHVIPFCSECSRFPLIVHQNVVIYAYKETVYL